MVKHKWPKKKRHGKLVCSMKAYTKKCVKTLSNFCNCDQDTSKTKLVAANKKQIQFTTMKKQKHQIQNKRLAGNFGDEFPDVSSIGKERAHSGRAQHTDTQKKHCWAGEAVRRWLGSGSDILALVPTFWDKVVPLEFFLLCTTYYRTDKQLWSSAPDANSRTKFEKLC